MNIIVISSSPNTDGLTAACATAAMEGVRQGGGEAQEVRLNDLAVANCQACGNAWGTCWDDHKCQEEDDFQALHEQVLAADGLILVTPVYWGEMSESMKAFADRLRRCEGTRWEESLLKEKPMMAVAAAGGSGNGMITCLFAMERWIEHVRGKKHDFVAVHRWNRPYKLEAIQAAAQRMAQGD